MEFLKTLAALIATLCCGFAVILLVDAFSLGTNGKSLLVPAVFLIFGTASIVLPEWLPMKGSGPGKVLLMACRIAGIFLVGCGILLTISVIIGGSV